MSSVSPVPFYNNGQLVDKVKQWHACSQGLHVHCSKLIKRWMMLLCRDVDCVWPPDGLKKYSFARLELRRDARTLGDSDFFLTGLPGSYCAPHPSISDTSMWDKSIMCLCNNCDNVWTIVSGEKDTHVVLRTICTMSTHPRPSHWQNIKATNHSM